MEKRGDDNPDYTPPDDDASRLIKAADPRNSGRSDKPSRCCGGCRKRDDAGRTPEPPAKPCEDNAVA